MLFKLCKHEIKCSYRNFLLLYAIILLATILLNPQNHDLVTTWSIIVFGVVSIVLFIMCIVVIIRNYNISMFSRNSYLTHSLPVTTTQLLLTKIFGALFWCIISTLVFVICILFILFRMSGFDTSLISQLCSNFMQSGLTSTLLFYALYMLISLAGTITITYMIMNITHTTYIQRHRGAITVLLYILISILISYVRDFALAPFIPALGMVSGNGAFSFMFSTNQLMFTTINENVSILVLSLWSLGILVGSFFIAKYILDHKLEIE